MEVLGAGKKGKNMAEKSLMNAIDCARRKGNLAFGLNEAKAAQMLRELASDLEAGHVVLQSVSTSVHATQEEFAVREIVIELLEESSDAERVGPPPGPRIIKK
jgi:hypothetical protein